MVQSSFFRPTAVMFALLVSSFFDCFPVQAKPNARARRVLPTGLRVERVAPKDLRRWESMKNIVFATDERGQPRHGTLLDLLGRLEASGHVIYLELITGESSNSSLGGVFRIEKLDPLGLRHTAVIRLYLNNIDRAYVGPDTMRLDGIIPFENLNREERYVEVLGHELAHAVWILLDLQRAAQVTEVIEQTNELFLQRRGQVDNDPVMLKRLRERDALIESLEVQAEAMEAIVWQELIASKGIKVAYDKTRAKKNTPPNLSSLHTGTVP